MTSIRISISRIALVLALAAAAVLAGAWAAHNSSASPVHAHHVVAGPVLCCEAV